MVGCIKINASADVIEARCSDRDALQTVFWGVWPADGP
jgi:hypothetical protein